MAGELVRLDREWERDREMLVALNSEYDFISFSSREKPYCEGSLWQMS